MATVKKATPAKSTKSPATKSPASATPLLDAAVVSNPHKTPAGWDGKAAKTLAAEFATHIAPTTTLQETAKIWKQYVPFTGHKNLARAFLAVCGEVAPDVRE